MSNTGLLPTELGESNQSQDVYTVTRKPVGLKLIPSKTSFLAAV